MLSGALRETGELGIGALELLLEALDTRVPGGGLLAHAAIDRLLEYAVAPLQRLQQRVAAADLVFEVRLECAAVLQAVEKVRE